MEGQCAGCGFVYDLGEAERVGRGVRERVAEAVAILRVRDVNVRARRQPDVWSPLEYGCHLRDVLLAQRERVLAARRTVRPDCPRWDVRSGSSTTVTPSRNPTT